MSGEISCIAAEPVIQHAYTPNDLLKLEIRRIFQSQASHCPKQNCRHHQEKKTTTTRHRDANTPAAGKSADEEHEVTTAAVAAKVRPNKGTVNDTKMSSATGAVNTNAPLCHDAEHHRPEEREGNTARGALQTAIPALPYHCSCLTGPDRP